MLQDYSHLLRVLRPEARRHDDAWVVCFEGDVEVVLAGETVGGDVGQRANNHLTHGGFRPFVVGKQAFDGGLLVVGHCTIHSANAEIRPETF
jgi:hypothetical protein